MSALFHLFARHAQETPDKTAFIGQGESYTYQALLDTSLIWAAAILAHHKPDQRPRVAMVSNRPCEEVILALALARLNGACIPTNRHLTPHQRLQGWQTAEATLVVYSDELADNREICNTHALSACPVSTLNAHKTMLNSTPDYLWQGERDFLITLSSGSTGTPKPIAISQHVKIKRAEQAWTLYDLSAQDVVLCASPFFHSLGQRLVFVPLLLGATLVHMDQFTPQEWVRLVECHRVSFVISVSSHLYALKNDLLERADKLTSLNTVVTSSAPIDGAFKEVLFQKIGCDFHEIYGATEIACATNLPPAFAHDKHQTVGLPCPDVDIRILDDDGNVLGHNQIGEIAVKTPLAFEGYYNRPELTQSSYKNGYFCTGDLGTIDTEGFLSYVSRKKDVIISGGINIYPKDIENTLSSHPEISEIAVIGVDDDLLGEVIVAICQSTAEEKTLERELRKRANRELAAFQRPLKYFFVKDLPKTASGKIAKNTLRQEYQDKNTDWSAPMRIIFGLTH